MKRPVEERRRLLKTLVAGASALTVGSALPDTWKKPIIDSVIVPLHAQGSTPSFIQTIQFAYSTSGGAEAVSGTLTPGNTPTVHVLNNTTLPAYDYQITPTIVLDPAITDTFNLTINETTSGGDSTNFTPGSQNLAPGAGGAIPFVPILGGVDNARYLAFQITLTPDNPAFTTFFLELTFDEAPVGPALP